MGKYNKNLWRYARMDVKTGFRSVAAVVFQVALVLLIVARAVMLISSVVTLNHYSASQINRPLVVTVIERSVFVLAFCVASFIFALFRQKFRCSSLSAAVGVLGAVLHFFDSSVFEKIKWIAVILPAALVVLTAIVFFIAVIRTHAKETAAYQHLSDRLYRLAVSKSPDGQVVSADLDKMMNDYHGEEIRIQPKKKDR